MASLPPVVRLSLTCSVPFVVRLSLRVDWLILLDPHLDLPSPSLAADAGNEEHVPDDVDRPWVCWSFLTD